MFQNSKRNNKLHRQKSANKKGEERYSDIGRDEERSEGEVGVDSEIHESLGEIKFPLTSKQ